MHDLIEAARFVHALKLDDIPEPVIARATLTLLDSFGVMVSGSIEPRVRQMAAHLRQRGGSGRSTYVTDGLAGSAQDAALVNSTSMCLHVEDEGHRLAFGHVGTYVLPAILAVAQERGASGRDLLTAFVAGYELTARLGMAFKVKNNVHPSGTYGPIGGAAAVAKLMGFGPEAILAAMDVAAPLTFSTLWRASAEGATVRDLYSGWGSTLSVMAPAWVDAGFTGCSDSVADVLSNHTGTAFDSRIAVSGLGTRWELQSNYFKLHACCGLFIPCIEEAMAMQARHGFSANEIERVSVKCFETAAVRSAHRKPDNVLAAKESLPVSLALAFTHRVVDRATYTDAKVFDPEIRRLADHVDVIGAADYEALTPGQRRFDIAIRLKDGRTLEGMTEGRVDAPQSQDEVLLKFDRCTSAVLEKDVAADLKFFVEGLRELPSLDDLGRILGSCRAC